jgi:hypothetical protein
MARYGRAAGADRVTRHADRRYLTDGPALHDQRRGHESERYDRVRTPSPTSSAARFQMLDGLTPDSPHPLFLLNRAHLLAMLRRSDEARAIAAMVAQVGPKLEALRARVP